MKNLLGIILVLFTLPLFGQAPEQPIERKGFVIGIGVGGGAISVSDKGQETPFDDANYGISFPNLKIGWMLSERLALLATFPGMIYEYDGKDRSFDAFIPSLQYWFKDRWWVNGGIGLSMDYTAIYEKDAFGPDDFHLGCAVALSSGYEIVQRKNFAIDLQGKVYLGRVFMKNDFYRDAAAITFGVGFNWY